jgi:hypothetical protein
MFSFTCSVIYSHVSFLGILFSAWIRLCATLSLYNCLASKVTTSWTSNLFGSEHHFIKFCIIDVWWSGNLMTTADESSIIVWMWDWIWLLIINIHFATLWTSELTFDISEYCVSRAADVLYRKVLRNFNKRLLDFCSQKGAFVGVSASCCFYGSGPVFLAYVYQVGSANPFLRWEHPWDAFPWS